MSAVLETRALRRNFGALAVTRDVSLTLAPGERHALIGPNGAGKSTFINLVAGQLRPDAGEVLLAGERIERLAPFARVRRGLVRSFQITALFDELTPLESVTLAICRAEGRSLAIFGARQIQDRAREEASRLLALVGLDAARTETRFLAYGQQRLLEVALALACRPKVLLLDEPAAGVPRSESRRLFDALTALPADIAVLLIEHDMQLVFRFARRISVLAEGALLAQGTPEEIAHDPEVRRAYLGG